MESKKTGINATNHMLCWNQGSSEVAVIPWPDIDNLGKRYRMSTLACNLGVSEMSFEQRKMIIFIEAMHLIVRDKCDALSVHEALLNLDEYRDGCADDMLLASADTLAGN